MSTKEVRVYSKDHGIDWRIFNYTNDEVDYNIKQNLKVYEILGDTSFLMKLFDDDSVREKLKVMLPIEAMFDDERNEVPDYYYKLLDSIKPGQSLRITVELLEEQNAN